MSILKNCVPVFACISLICRLIGRNGKRERNKKQAESLVFIVLLFLRINIIHSHNDELITMHHMVTNLPPHVQAPQPHCRYKEQHNYFSNRARRDQWCLASPSLTERKIVLAPGM